jgi:hypothetical protein
MSPHGYKLQRHAAALVVALLSLGLGAPSDATVRRVGTFNGMPGDYTTIQDAVDAAQAGDWILIAPGDYKERGDFTHPGPDGGAGAGVLIRTPNLHVRGLDRNAVVIDGTQPGSALCDSAAGAQLDGPLDMGGQPEGRNGIEAFEVDGVTIENLTVCNFLTGSYGGGNQIWFNGGDGSGSVNLNGYRGAYLSATSTVFLGDDGPGAEYGIFASNVHGPGLIEHTYASNMRDASYYVGACPDCNTIIRFAHAENSALGYSGTNSGGNMILEKSEWDENTTGISMNSQNNDDAPSPQDGACPAGSPPPRGAHSCTVVRHNYIHDNNNPNVPSSGSAALAPVGTGIVIAGGRDDTVMRNKILNHGAWGVLVVPFPDTGPPPPVAHCQGGLAGFLLPGVSLMGACFYDSWGHDVNRNAFANNGFFGNVSNGDLGDLSSQHDPGNCWHSNHDKSHVVTTAPAALQMTHRQCGVPNAGAAIIGSDLSNQVICATQAFGPCADAPGHHYPRTTAVALKPLPPQPTMPKPCVGVPPNPWCS